MSREAFFLKILESSARIQREISLILEAQADEAEKSRNWLCTHIQPHLYPDHEKQLKHALGVHEHLISLIDGVTRVEFGLARNLKVVLESGAEADLGVDGLAELFGSEPGAGHGTGPGAGHGRGKEKR